GDLPDRLRRTGHGVVQRAPGVVGVLAQQGDLAEGELGVEAGQVSGCRLQLGGGQLLGDGHVRVEAVRAAAERVGPQRRLQGGEGGGALVDRQVGDRAVGQEGAGAVQAQQRRGRRGGGLVDQGDRGGQLLVRDGLRR